MNDTNSRQFNFDDERMTQLMVDGSKESIAELEQILIREFDDWDIGELRRCASMVQNLPAPGEIDVRLKWAGIYYRVKYEGLHL